MPEILFQEERLTLLGMAGATQILIKHARSKSTEVS
jgi:hypothetical protein